ncbi:MAG: hypothetical protein OXG44_17385 [Gammaproteobacteria bacterium]|nr:hypothetical protein [Gammaproteobacteria bacterium]
MSGLPRPATRLESYYEHSLPGATVWPSIWVLYLAARAVPQHPGDRTAAQHRHHRRWELRRRSGHFSRDLVGNTSHWTQP